MKRPADVVDSLRDADPLNRALRRGAQVGATDIPQFYFPLAVDLARAGRYADAERLLLEVDRDERLRPAVLDLRGKIYAQQGRCTEAEACWLEALSLTPGNEHYRKALDALAGGRRYPAWLRMAASAIAAAISAAGLILSRRLDDLDRKVESLKQSIPREASGRPAERETPGQ